MILFRNMPKSGLQHLLSALVGMVARVVMVGTVVMTVTGTATVFAELPPLPFEPFDTGPQYTRADQPPPLRRHGLPDDPFLNKQWHLHNIGQDDDKGQPGVPGVDIAVFPALAEYQAKESVILAILDSGIDLTHEDMNHLALWENPGEIGIDANGNDKRYNGIDDDGNGYIDDVHGWNFVRNTNDIQDDQYHGTHCGGLLCAAANNAIGITGAYPPVKIMLVKIFGLGKTLSSAEIAQAVRYAVDNGARVLSNSYGTPSFTEAAKQGVAYAHQHGALFVCASGNSRKNLDDPEEADYPSCYGFPNQLVVGATDNCDRSSFSNYGSCVEIAAPGQAILSLMPKQGYRSFSGTSQACPLVAGAAAMVWSQNPDWSWKEVKATLLNGADQIRGLARYVRGGLRLNLSQAITGKTGVRLPVYDFSQWRKVEKLVESKHPYQNNSVANWIVTVPNAQRIRLHFTRLAVDHHGDFLSITDTAGKPVETINGRFDAHWSEVIEGDTAYLELSSNEYVNDFGFHIDHVQCFP